MTTYTTTEEREFSAQMSMSDLVTAVASAKPVAGGEGHEQRVHLRDPGDFQDRGHARKLRRRRLYRPRERHVRQDRPGHAGGQRGRHGRGARSARPRGEGLQRPGALLMTPAKQLFTNADETRPVGDCLRTCIAMLLDLPVEEVPHFVDLYYDTDEDVVTDRWPDFKGTEVRVPAWAAACQVWLRERGLEMYSYDGPPGDYTGFAIATGPSPRGDFSHAIVVYTIAMDREDRGDGILHPVQGDWRPAADPHPSNDYLAGPPTEFAVIQPAEIWIEGPS